MGFVKSTDAAQVWGNIKHVLMVKYVSRASNYDKGTFHRIFDMMETSLLSIPLFELYESLYSSEPSCPNRPQPGRYRRFLSGSSQVGSSVIVEKI